MESLQSPVVTWELTRACRLTCAHCPAGAQAKRSPLELSTYEAYKTIDQIAAMHPQELIVTGGDPLERSDIYQLLDYAHRRALAPTLTVTASPALTGAAIGTMKRNGLTRIAIALDSAKPDRHDAARGVGGLFASTLLAIRWARTVALPVEVNTLVTKTNMDELRTIAALLGDLHVERWNLYFVVPIGDAKHIGTLTADEVEQVFGLLWDVSQKAPYKIRTFEAPHYRRFVIQKAAAARTLEVNDYADLSPVDCAEQVFISHTGEVSLSPFLPLTAGNVRYQPLSTIYQRSDLFAAVRTTANLKGKCGKCEFRSVCRGSRARAFAMTGDMFASDPLCAYHPGAFVAETPILH
ncbi:MAG TPA: radical SAM protein [Thermoanaerobaculia bacterium]|nr:radical SAM protein [Thermoanaerobaculia bacterium]